MKNTAKDDPYAAYLTWLDEGKPSLAPADLQSPIPLPTADDAVEHPNDAGPTPSQAAA